MKLFKTSDINVISFAKTCLALNYLVLCIFPIGVLKSFCINDIRNTIANIVGHSYV